jgi:hypothetical protein
MSGISFCDDALYENLYGVSKGNLSESDVSSIERTKAELEARKFSLNTGMPPHEYHAILKQRSLADDARFLKQVGIRP